MQDLARRIAELSLLRGEFTLRSGRTSSYYLDKYRFSTDPGVLRALAPQFGEAVRRICPEMPDRLAGAELGGIPLVTVASLETGLPAVFVRNQKKDYGTAQRLEGVLEPGDRVVVIEDVATSGGQSIEACAAVREIGGNPLGVVCTIDREEGAREAVESEGIRFEALFTKSDLGIRE